MADFTKIPLTSRALGEFDHQASLEKRESKREENKREWPSSTPSHICQADTSEQIRRFAQDGDLYLSDLRGYPPPTSQTMTPSTTKEETSAYEDDFEWQLFGNDIYMNAKSKPQNLKEIKDRLLESRVSSPLPDLPDSAFEVFQQRTSKVLSNSKVMSTILPLIHGNASFPNEEGLEFAMLNSITSEATGHAKPDFYDGVGLGDIERMVRNELSPIIVPTAHATAPVLPNFFVEVKGPLADDFTVMTRRACHNGALGARAMQSLQSYGQPEPVYDGNAYTISATFQGGTGILAINAIHPTKPKDPKGRPSYHLTELRILCLENSLASFQEGVNAFRNAREWAGEQRDKFVTAANERAKAMIADTQSQTPADESLNTKVSDAAAATSEEVADEPNPSTRKDAVTVLEEPAADAPNPDMPNPDVGDQGDDGRAPIAGTKRRSRSDASTSPVSKLPRHEDDGSRSRSPGRRRGRESPHVPEGSETRRRESGAG